MLILKHNIVMSCIYFSRIKIKYVLIFVILLASLEFFGVFTHIFEVDFHKHFSYPFEGDIRLYINQLKNKETPDVSPINIYNYTFLSNCSNKCHEDEESSALRLVYIVKSATKHFDRRMAIRNSWGFEKRFSDVFIQTVFILGINDDALLQIRITEEQRKYGDIVQANFLDSYYNNTIKTMIGFKWAVTLCPNSKFYMFSDDDMYISTKNVLRFVRNPTHYPEYLEMPVISLKSQKRDRRFIINNEPKNKSLVLHHTTEVNTNYIFTRRLKQVLDFELPEDVKLYAGYVFVSAPLRHRSSKWYVPLSEYPFHLWPAYVTAGTYILSKEALTDMYYASFYTKHFRFDDIYLGLVAKKADVEPFHCEEFHFYKKEYDVFNYRYVISSHGYDDPGKLLQVWNEQRSAGNA